MKHIIYRYTDNRDGVVKYVGLTERALKLRVNEHQKNDVWVKSSNSWRIEYFYVDTKSESEAWESHLIALYKTYNWFNKAKATWGLIKAFENINPCWNIYSDGDDMIDICLTRYPLIYDESGLISETELILEYDLSELSIQKLIAKRVIFPIARNKYNLLLFSEDDRENIEEYTKKEMNL